MTYLALQMTKKQKTKSSFCFGRAETALRARQGEILEESASHHIRLTQMGTGTVHGIESCPMAPGVITLKIEVQQAQKFGMFLGKIQNNCHHFRSANILYCGSKESTW